LRTSLTSISLILCIVITTYYYSTSSQEHKKSITYYLALKSIQLEFVQHDDNSPVEFKVRNNKDT